MEVELLRKEGSSGKPVPCSIEVVETEFEILRIRINWKPPKHIAGLCELSNAIRTLTP
jgi:hypothetical protein